MVRAGRDSAYFETFRNESIIGLGWSDVGEVAPDVSDEELNSRFDKVYPNEKPATRRTWAGQFRRFLKEMEIGDKVATYNREERIYMLGTIASGVETRKGEPNTIRRVKWSDGVARDSLSVGTRNSLGSIATLFQPSEDAAIEVWQKASPLGNLPAPIVPAENDSGDEAAEQALREETVGKAEQFIEDHINELDWDEMQELVAGILRAMGYRTRISESGPDRGVDIFASPDGLGLEEPRIFCEVKHRKGAMGAPEIRTFLGGRRPADRCLYVSTGGFSKEARYEADRASVPLRLISLSDLRELLVEHYEKLDAETRALVPLRRLYWPVK
jgi:restriction system protein